MVARAEASLCERFASIEERVAAADAKRQARSRAKAAPAEQAAVGALPRQEGSADDASPVGGRSLSRRPSAADALAAPPPAADPSGAALPRMMADF